MRSQKVQQWKRLILFLRKFQTKKDNGFLICMINDNSNSYYVPGIILNYIAVA